MSDDPGLANFYFDDDRDWQEDEECSVPACGEAGIHTCKKCGAKICDEHVSFEGVFCPTCTMPRDRDIYVETITLYQADYRNIAEYETAKDDSFDLGWDEVIESTDGYIILANIHRIPTVGIWKCPVCQSELGHRINCPFGIAFTDGGKR